jgi:hypothetical protein
VNDRIVAEVELKKAGIKSAKMAVPEILLLSA